MKKIAAAVLLSLAPVIAFAQSLGDKIELSVQGRLIEATLAERLSSENSYRLTFEDRYGDAQHLGFLHKRGDNQLISITHPDVGEVEIRRIDGETYIHQRNRAPSEPLKPKRRPEPVQLEKQFQVAPRKAALMKANNAQITSLVTQFDNNIDVLFLYDERLLGYAEDNNEDLALRIEAAVTTSNAIFERSQLPVEMSVAGVDFFNPESTTNFPTEDPNAIVDELVDDQRVRRLMDRYQADVVHFIGAENSEVCGLAFVATDFNVSDNLVNRVSGAAGAGYTALSCTGSGTVAHEVGHNFGLNHDRYTLADNASGGGGDQEDYHIPYGFIEDNGRFYTTMSYGGVCRSEFGSGAECRDEAVYSSPDIVDSDSGLPMGKAASEIDAADASTATQRSTVVWANNASRTNVNAMAASRTGNSELTLSWPAVANADRYALAGGRCEQYESASRETLLNLQSFSVNSIALGGIPNGSTDICVIAIEELTNGAARWRFVSNASFSGDFSNSGASYLLLDSNVMSLVKAGDQASFNIELSDADTSNESLQVAIPTTASGTSVSQGVGIATAEQWFDWIVTGSGSTRMMTVTLKTDIDEIAGNLDKDNIYNPFHWRLKVVNTNFNDFDVSSGLWNDPSDMVGSQPRAFLSSGDTVGELEDLDAQLSLFNVSNDVVVSVVNLDDDLISNFSFNEVSGAVDGERRFAIDGVAGIVDSEQTGILRVDFSDGSDSLRVALTVEPRAIAPTITGFTASGTTEGQTVRLAAIVSDADLNLAPASLRLFRVLESGEEEVTDFSFNDGVFNASLGQLAAGSYQYRLSVSDTEGNTDSATTRFTVAAADSGSSGGHGGWLVVLVALALGLRRR
ncbi:reprolysin-like metallo-peptidase family M12B [Idiomarina loihiensis]|uniref:zinc-dependent metalloprotease family protein n=1 Tax=Idiomarina TaxID=135575 RepID=UPI000D719D17|nr:MULTISPECIES: zinc-dependent metalloprotease family protein [Idiomarina]PWW36932.1 reprolysin-like metallo-peptidase family M12B [Idiomarina loihiensis]TDP46740.1 reprolysin-like metallo-peptidase family M12B [Idiomarina loihiensis]TDS23011.1 reprolysin-like metallo-peptidase family M12B [Idiomarina sp. H2]